WTAPTETALGPQAGLETALVRPPLPEATAERMPAVRALSTAMASASVGQALVNEPPPRLRLMATMLYLALFWMVQLMALRMSLVQAPPPANTSRATTWAAGATDSTMPETLVPWPLSSTLPSSGAKSRAKTMGQVV